MTIHTSRQGDEEVQGSDCVLSVVVPARNEEACLEACLRSLVAQSEPGWLLGEHWELIVVDDSSTDRTAEIARALPSVVVITARTPLPKGWTGKNNALWTGASQARGRWLLFTDADTVHAAGSGSRAVIEAERHKVGMLSWSPRQRVYGLLQRVLMPLVFSELATAYPSGQVNEAGRRLAVATGQFLLLRAEALRMLGGLERVASSVIEDVDLAWAAKSDKRIGLRFRYAPEMVEARMYRAFSTMWLGWAKNLALLLPSALYLALWRLLDLVLVWGLPVVALVVLPTVGWNSPSLHLYQAIVGIFWLRTLFRVGRRAARSNFARADTALAVLLGLPLFAALCWWSWYRIHVLRRVSWKGREYPVGRNR